MGEYSPDSALPPTLGSNTPGPHPASITRPIHHPEWDQASASGYRVSNHVIGESVPRRNPFKVIIIGAGASGIDFLHHAKTALSGLNVKLRCVEKNSDVGGTWLENRYPGCACDVPSASYQFPWRPNPHWSQYYSGAREIWAYMKAVALDEGLTQYMEFGVEVKGATWVDETARWVVKLAKVNGQEWEEQCDVLLNATGVLNNWKWPDIPGLHSFRGDLFHTARYPENFDLKGKRVAVIGTGSSGVQTVASVYPDADKLYTWVRSPTWITAGFAQKFAGKDGANFDYTEQDKLAWEQDPEKYREYRKMIEHELNQRFKLVLRNSAESQQANEFSYREMTAKLAENADIAAHIIPQNFNVACRRPTPGNGYLEALIGEKTTIFMEDVAGITPKGFTVQSGEEYACDVIICATGFDTSFRPRFPITGINGKSLSELWSNMPESYLGLAVPRMPNYFMFTGPFTPTAQGSILPLITSKSKHILQIIRKMYVQHIRRMVPRDSAIADFMEHCQAYLPRTCWADPCSSWFKQGRVDGPIAMWPGSRLAYLDVMRSPQWEDYDVEYDSGNRFGFLGSGFHVSEFEANGNITDYLDGNVIDAPPRALMEELYNGN
ncbi:FAD/NAD(P)-binding domain-containing protein [Aspergillus campestris IBT 28561]|uniref:FAD/NAD(P)-binding domain-containing protein n=1 Tax=Aspergillus campestris (strain IBT 28561) TaxID=1392248 RepID=A0A2I1CS80_ASPC2|nr:FAD/NAD(P)-binding domain-containing protein [Aspergillus campestris IBT 28561]PKY00473.1 FAD/NAD(P)-binding domain-containing protein [Aspergillus campestris IBT 28561]